MHGDRRLKVIRIAAPALLVALWSTNLVLAQSQTQTPPQPEPKSRPAPPSPIGVTPKSKTKKDNSAADKVYTDDDLERLPSGGVSVVGPPAPPPSAATTNGEASARSGLPNQEQNCKRQSVLASSIRGSSQQTRSGPKGTSSPAEPTGNRTPPARFACRRYYTSVFGRIHAPPEQDWRLEARNTK
jgi:hypothetical protein